MFETIKEYLIGIGFKVDDSSMQKARQAMQGTEKVLANFATTTAGNFAIAAVGITTFFAIAEAGFAKFIGGLANTDMEIQKFSRHMFMTQQNAYGVKMAMDAMGAKSMSDLQDIAMIPEQRERFQNLRAEANSLMPSKEYETYMKQVRDIQFELSRMQMEATIGFQKTGYFFLKYMQEPIMEFLNGLKTFNFNFIQNLPQLAKGIASGMSDIFNLTNSIIELLNETGILKVVGLIAKEFIVATGNMIKGLTAIIKLVTALVKLIKGDLNGAIGDLKAFNNISVNINHNAPSDIISDKIVNGIAHSGQRIQDFLGIQKTLPMTESRQHYVDMIKRIGKQMGASQHDIAAALAAAMQESGLQNLKHGDRDSLGLYQQRPSQGWGSPQQIMTPEYAIANFYRHLLNIQDRGSKSITDLDQMVQRSAYPQAYQKWTSQAEQLSKQPLTQHISFYIQGNNSNAIASAVETRMKSLSNRNYAPIIA